VPAIGSMPKSHTVLWPETSQLLAGSVLPMRAGAVNNFGLKPCVLLHDLRGWAMFRSSFSRASTSWIASPAQPGHRLFAKKLMDQGNRD